MAAGTRPVEREIRTALWTSQHWPPFLDAEHRAHLGHCPREFMGKVGDADAAVAGEVESLAQECGPLAGELRQRLAAEPRSVAQRP